MFDTMFLLIIVQLLLKFLSETFSDYFSLINLSGVQQGTQPSHLLLSSIPQSCRPYHAEVSIFLLIPSYFTVGLCALKHN